MVSDWKSYFKKDIIKKMSESKKEYDNFKNTASIIYLQQAGNKIFSIVENYLILKYNNRVKSYKQLYHMISSKADKQILFEANQLHRFFYNGELQMEVFEADRLYLTVYNKMKARLK